MKKLLIIWVLLIFSTPLMAQWQVGIDLLRLPHKTLDLGANYFFGKRTFISMRAGYAFGLDGTTYLEAGNLERSPVSGYFWAGGLGFTFPTKNKGETYFGTEVMRDIASRDYIYSFGGTYGSQEVRVKKDFTTIGWNMYLGTGQPIIGKLRLDAQIRLNALSSDLNFGDRLVAPSIGADNASGDPSLAIKINFVMKLSYRFSRKALAEED